MITKKMTDALKPATTKLASSKIKEPSQSNQPHSQTLNEPDFFKPNSIIYAEYTQNQNKKNVKTSITVKYNVGFGNSLSLRGEGANLSWTHGQALKNVKDD